ncbi:MAG: capA [Candidatus Magasanikbacteria bacterium]|nr:capA [Candidatus Magasanikbacteria bacterium]
MYRVYKISVFTAVAILTAAFFRFNFNWADDGLNKTVEAVNILAVENIRPPSLPNSEDTNTEEWSLAVVGDVMLARKVGKIIRERGATSTVALIAPVLHESDAVFGNLESVISDLGAAIKKEIVFRAATSTMDVLTQAGIGQIGYPLAVPVYINVRGHQTAWFAFDDTGHKLTVKIIAEKIKTAKMKAEVVIISLHWGNEYQKNATKHQRDLAHGLIDAGATLVVGHHPHIIQGLEQYQNGLIFYSLGNFLFDQDWSEETQRGLLGQIYFQGNTIRDLKILPLDLHNQKVRVASGTQRTAILKAVTERSFVTPSSTLLNQALVKR